MFTAGREIYIYIRAVSAVREGEALLVVGSFSAAGFQSAGEETILKMATSMGSVDRGRPLSIGYTEGCIRAWRGEGETVGPRGAVCRAIIYCCIVSRMCSYPSGGPTFAWRPCLHLNCVLPPSLPLSLPSSARPRCPLDEDISEARELFGAPSSNRPSSFCSVAFLFGCQVQ